MRLLGLDFETTGLDPATDVVIEVGAVLWDTDRKCPLVIDNFFIDWAGDGPQVSKETVKITGITQRDLSEFGIKAPEAYSRLLNQIRMSEAIVAHNGKAFDQLFWNAWTKKLHKDTDPTEPIWIDTMIDLNYSEGMSSRKLTYLAADHGFLNPFAHRAVFDVFTMLRVLSNYDIQEVLFSANQPIVLVQALVSYNDRELAKERGFRWDPEKKAWLRLMKAHKVSTEKFLFQTRTIAI
jgi:DNA polymerase-3 subunit epsilon